MKKVKKKVLRRTMALVLGIMSIVGMWQNKVYAEETFSVNIDQYNAQDGKIHVYVNHNQGSGYCPTKEDCKLLIGKQTPEVEDVATFQNLNEPVSYLLMVDVSGSMDAERVEQAKDVMKQLVNNKKENDNFSIAILGNDIKASGFSENQDQMISYIDEIAVTNEDTNLYAAIKQELEVLQTENAVHKKRCMVIFSDGADDRQVGITKAEAENIVKESHIPIFTVAMLDKRLRDADKENAKILGSFARDSAGGKHFAPLVDEGSYNNIADEIRDRIDSSLVLTADLSEVIVGDDTVYIEAELSSATGKAKGSITVPSGSIKEQVEIAKQRVAEVNINVSEEEQAEPVEEQPEVEEKDDIGKLITVIIIALIVVALLLILFITIQHKSRQDEAEYEKDMEGYEAGDNFVEISDYPIQDHPSTVAPVEGQSINAPVKKKYPKKITFTMFKIGPGDEVKYELTVKDEITIGRNDSCTLTLKDDNALSGRHCSVIYRDGDVFVRDNESTNGTYANGVPIVGELQISKDDILLIGSNEYRINWE